MAHLWVMEKTLSEVSFRSSTQKINDVCTMTSYGFGHEF